MPANARPGDVVGDPIEATDPGGAAITYSLRNRGEEAPAVDVDPDTGQLTVREGASLTEGDEYRVTIVARAASGPWPYRRRHHGDGAGPHPL